MVRIPPWVWIAIAVVGVLAALIQQSSQASYFRGIADDAESRLVAQGLVLESVSAHADSLADALAQADSAADENRLLAEREVERLTRAREASRIQSEALSAGLRASLDSAQAVGLDAVVASFEAQVSALESVVEVERELTATERIRATMATELVVSLNLVITQHEQGAAIMAVEIKALRSSIRPSFGLRLKADWWMAAVGFAAGAMLTK